MPVILVQSWQHAPAKRAHCPGVGVAAEMVLSHECISVKRSRLSQKSMIH